jgi:hypothetical protein
MFENMIKNEVNILKEENKEQLSILEENEQDIIKDIMKSMSIFKVNSYDAEVIKRDLIGMAQDLNLRGSSLKEDIGDNLKEFTQDIINNSSGPSKSEIILGFLIKISGSIFIGFTVLAFIAYGGLSWNTNPNMLFFYIVYGSTMFITEVIITPLFIMESGFLKNLPSIISISFIIILITIVYRLNIIESTKVINVSYIIGTSGLIYLVSKYLYINNIHKLAKDKRNYIQDLR